MNWVNLTNFIASTLRFSEKFYHPFSHVCIFSNMFPESHGFIVMPVTNFIKIHVPIYPYLISEGIGTKLFALVKKHFSTKIFIFRRCKISRDWTQKKKARREVVVKIVSSEKSSSVVSVVAQVWNQSYEFLTNSRNSLVLIKHFLGNKTALVAEQSI